MSKKNEEKYLYWFKATDKNGKDRKFCILKPTRKMKEDGELFYASKLSQFISAGVLPKIVWEKIFKDTGGIISESDQKEYSDLFYEYAEYKNSLEELSSKTEEKSAEESSRVLFLESQVIRVRKRMQELEMAQVNAFENTAEAKARNRTIVWWAANLSVEEDAVSGSKSLLGNGSMDEKLDEYDLIIENDDFLTDCFSRLNYLITVWYLGSASDFKDFEKLDLEYAKRIEEEKGVSSNEKETPLIQDKDAKLETVESSLQEDKASDKQVD